jgi:hypothetical protein
MKQGYLKDNDVPLSDQATMVEYWTRHDNIMTIVEFVIDPIYLEEPYVLSSNYELDVHSELEFFPCTVIEENISQKVPHYLPGKNPYLNDWLAKYGVPEEAARRGQIRHRFATSLTRIRQLNIGPHAQEDREAPGAGRINPDILNQNLRIRRDQGPHHPKGCRGNIPRDNNRLGRKLGTAFQAKPIPFLGQVGTHGF